MKKKILIAIVASLATVLACQSIVCIHEKVCAVSCYDLDKDGDGYITEHDTLLGDCDFDEDGIITESDKVRYQESIEFQLGSTYTVAVLENGATVYQEHFADVSSAYQCLMYCTSVQSGAGQPLEVLQYNLWDINGDGSVSVLDAYTILQKATIKSAGGES